MYARRLTALAAALCLAVTSCASEGLASLPLPAPGVGSAGYTLTAVFSNALNLPANAKVKLAGADVGQLESMVARNYTAVTTLRIMDGVRLPRAAPPNCGRQRRSVTCSSRSSRRARPNPVRRC